MLGKIWKFITNVLLVVLVALVAMLVLPRVFGIQPLVVLSGSMEPTYHVGSLIYVADIKPEKLEVGDAVTYTISDDGTMVTHRIVEIDQDNQCVYTKGDANNANDGGAISYTSIVGKPLFSIPYMGRVAHYFTTSSGTIILITGVIVVLILVFMSELIVKVNDEEKSSLKDGSKHEKNPKK